MWLLAIEDDEGTTTFHRLSGERCTLGRAPDNDVVLAQFNVSRHHGRLEREGEGWRYFDQDSSNGSFFNGCRLLGSTLVGFDDSLQLGGYRLTFREGLQTNVPTPRPYYVPPARLRVLAGPGEGTEYSFRRNEVVTIGRADECSMQILHERIIGIHARVRPLSGGRYEVVDESNRGIVVNGRRMACKVLEGGDTIALAGVSVLRYFERGQSPDPRFDHAISEGALEAAQAVGVDPFTRSGMYSINTEAAPAHPPEGRVEMVGPKSLPAPAPVPISFKLAREATVLPKQRGRSHDRPSRRLSFTVETPARPVSLPTQTPRPTRISVERPEVLTPTGLRRDRVMRVIKRRRALEAAVAIAAVGSAVALARGVVRTTVEHAAALRPVAGKVAGVDRPRLDLNPAPAEGPPSASARAKPQGPSTVAASEVRPVEQEPPAEAPAASTQSPAEAPAASAQAPAEPGTSRSALEARIRAGRASPAELRSLLRLCTQDGDDECVRRAREQLARGRQPR